MALISIPIWARGPDKKNIQVSISYDKYPWTLQAVNYTQSGVSKALYTGTIQILSALFEPNLGKICQIVRHSSTR